MFHKTHNYQLTIIIFQKTSGPLDPLLWCAYFLINCVTILSNLELTLHVAVPLNIIHQNHNIFQRTSGNPIGPFVLILPNISLNYMFARFVAMSPHFTRSMPLPKFLHWLPVRSRIIFKI